MLWERSLAAILVKTMCSARQVTAFFQDTA